MILEELFETCRIMPFKSNSQGQTPKNGPTSTLFNRKKNNFKLISSESTQSTIATAQLRSLTLKEGLVHLGVICSTVPESLTIMHKRSDYYDDSQIYVLEKRSFLLFALLANN